MGIYSRAGYVQILLSCKLCSDNSEFLLQQWDFFYSSRGFQAVRCACFTCWSPNPLLGRPRPQHVPYRDGKENFTLVLFWALQIDFNRAKSLFTDVSGAQLATVIKIRIYLPFFNIQSSKCSRSSVEMKHLPGSLRPGQITRIYTANFICLRGIRCRTGATSKVKWELFSFENSFFFLQLIPPFLHLPVAAALVDHP